MTPAGQHDPVTVFGKAGTPFFGFPQGRGRLTSLQPLADVTFPRAHSSTQNAFTRSDSHNFVAYNKGINRLA